MSVENKETNPMICSCFLNSVPFFAKWQWMLLDIISSETPLVFVPKILMTIKDSLATIVYNKL